MTATATIGESFEVSTKEVEQNQIPEKPTKAELRILDAQNEEKEEQYKKGLDLSCDTGVSKEMRKAAQGKVIVKTPHSKKPVYAVEDKISANYR